MRRETESLTRGSPVEARPDEAREPEGFADDERLDSGVPSNPRGFRPEVSPSADEVNARSEFARHLQPHVFPATANQLVASATSEHASDDLVARLRVLPSGVRFENVQAVWHALGGHTERRR
jgi:hypothetical protein